MKKQLSVFSFAAFGAAVLMSFNNPMLPEVRVNKLVGSYTQANYIHAKKEDLVAIFAYLKSCKPVENVVPQPIAPDKL